MGSFLVGRKALLIAGCILAAQSLASATPISIDVDDDEVSANVYDGNFTKAGKKFYFNVGFRGTVTDVDLQLALEHAWISELTITLTSPDGTLVTIFDRHDDSEGETEGLLDTRFDDGASSTLADTSEERPYTGSYWVDDYSIGIKGNNLAKFNSKEMFGSWKLLITNNNATEGGGGTLLRPNSMWGDSATTQGTRLILVPEPMTVGVLALGAVVILARRRRRMA